MDDAGHAEEQHGARRSVREQLLQAATELFAIEGSRGTGLSAIAKQIGVTTPAITHHFGTKQALVTEVVERTVLLSQEMLVRTSDSSGLEQLTANSQWPGVLMGDAQLSNLSRLMSVMTAEALDPNFSARPKIVNTHREFRQSYLEMVTAGQQDGSIRTDVEPKVIAAQLVAFIYGAQAHWLLDPDDVPIQEMFTDYFARLERDLAPPPHGPGEGAPTQQE